MGVLKAMPPLDLLWSGAPWRPYVLLAVLVLLPYSASWDNAFHFDDRHSLVENPHIRHWENIPSFFTQPRMFSANQGSQMYRPVVLLSYAANYAIGAYGPLSYRVFNLGVHLGVVCLAFLLYQVLGAKRQAAFVAAAFLAMTPLAGEPVNYISARSESVALFFMLAAFVAYCRAAPCFSPLALVCGIVALLSKSTAVVLPALLLLYELLLAVDRTGRIRRLLPLGLAAAIYIWLTRALLQEALGAEAVRPWGQQVLTQAKALAYYAKLLVFPWPLSVEHQFRVSESVNEAAVLAALFLVGTLAWCLWRGGAWGRFWGGWSLVVMAPTLIVPLNVLVNERRLYPVLIAFYGLLSVWWPECRCRRWAWGCVGILGLSVLGGLSLQRSQDWADEESLWTAARHRAPQAVRPHLRLGSVYRSQGDFAAADRSYQSALRLDSSAAPVYNNLGTLALDRGDEPAAEAAYLKALGLAPNYLEVLINLGTLYSRQQRHAEALARFEQALPLGPYRMELHNNLGIAYLRLSRFAEAETALRRALELGGEQSAILFNLGGALEGRGRRDEAVAVYLRAVETERVNAKPYFNLGRLYEDMGKLDQALAAYKNFVHFWHGAPALSEAVHRDIARLEGRL
jgi:protein O-mannosyl-transferase